MHKKNLIIWGARGQAKVYAEFADQQGYSIVALFDNDRALTSPLPGVPLFYGWEALVHWQSENAVLQAHALVAMGGSRGKDRLYLQQKLAAQGLLPARFIHPTAFVASTAKIGVGSSILWNATISAEVEMGDSCLVNGAACVEHESILGDGVHIGPGATLCGCVQVGDFSFIGAGAVVLPRIRIGRDVIIGAGAVVTRDIPDGMVAYGNPARIAHDNPEAANNPWRDD